MLSSYVYPANLLFWFNTIPDVIFPRLSCQTLSLIGHNSRCYLPTPRLSCQPLALVGHNSWCYLPTCILPSSCSPSFDFILQFLFSIMPFNMTEIFHLSHFYFLSSVPLPFPAYLEALNCDDSKSASVDAIPICMRIVVNYICIAKLVGAVALWLIVERKDCYHKLNVFATF